MAISGAKDLAGSREVAYRIVPVIFGLGLIPLLSAAWPTGWAGPRWSWQRLLTAISPALVFYSRYYIQETLLVFFTLAALGCGWRYLRSRRLAWILAAGAAVGMMHATKETWILSAAAAVARRRTDLGLVPAARSASRPGRTPAEGRRAGIRASRCDFSFTSSPAF